MYKLDDDGNGLYLLGASGAMYTNEGWVQYEGEWYYVYDSNA
ncbi:hypothetical protein ACIGHG_20890 [Bacillus sp. NPDC077411]